MDLEILNNLYMYFFVISYCSRENTYKFLFFSKYFFISHIFIKIMIVNTFSFFATEHFLSPYFLFIYSSFHLCISGKYFNPFLITVGILFLQHKSNWFFKFIILILSSITFILYIFFSI